MGRNPQEALSRKPCLRKPFATIQKEDSYVRKSTLHCTPKVITEFILLTHFIFRYLDILKYILLIMLLHFIPLFILLLPAHLLPPAFLPFSSCPWVVHISSLASSFPTLFLTTHCFLPTIYASYSL